MKLLIISHTEHYQLPDGSLVGWGPTITEINHLTALFDTIYHIGMLHEGLAPQSALPYTSKNIHFIPLPALGGPSVGQKLQLLWQAPRVIGMVRHALKQVDIFQLRAPTGIGVFLIPYLTWFSRKKGWFKYAGNWNQPQAPLGYAWQRWFLKQQSRTVTINGVWPKQPKHCISFPNPCLSALEYQEGLSLLPAKHMEAPLELCYAGRMEHDKGVGRLLQALKSMNPEDTARVKTLHLIGDGLHIGALQEMAKDTMLPIVWHGSLPRTALFAIYKKCQVFVMPTTASEGFPKVLAEAMNFGCIPVVTDVSAVSHFIKHKEHGLLLSKAEQQTIVSALHSVVNLNTPTYQQMLKAQRGMLKQFTFDHYNAKIKAHILQQKQKY